MYTDILRGIDGIGIFPLISLLLFVTVFAVMIVRVARIDRRELERRARMPLDTHDSGSADGRTR
jgi:cytochrome c oxidase cbb3-type subunit 4